MRKLLAALVMVLGLAAQAQAISPSITALIDPACSPAGNCGSTSNLASYNTPSVTPTSGDLVLVIVTAMGNSGNAPTITYNGSGLTFTNIATKTYNTNTTPTASLTVARGTCNSCGSNTITITYSATTSLMWRVLDVAGSDVANGEAQTIVQTVSVNNVDTTSTNPTSGTVAELGSANNMMLVTFGSSSVNSATCESSPVAYTCDGGFFSQSTPGVSNRYEYHVGNLSPNFTANFTQATGLWAVMAIEIKAATGVIPADITHGTSTSITNTYTTAAVTATNNDYIHLAVIGLDIVGTPTVSGEADSWTLVDSQSFSTIATPTVTLSIFKGSCASCTSSAITITFPGTSNGAAWLVYDIANSATPSQAVRQDVHNAVDATNLIGVTYGMSLVATNLALACIAEQNVGTIPSATPKSGWTQGNLLTFTHGGNSGGLVCEWRSDAADTNPTSTGANSPDQSMIALEISKVAITSGKMGLLLLGVAED